MKSEKAVKVLSGAESGRDRVNSSKRVIDAVVMQARHASRKLKSLTINV